MLPTVFWILEGYRKLYEVRSTSPALGLHLFADMSELQPDTLDLTVRFFPFREVTPRMPSWAVLAADNKKPTPLRGGLLVGGTSAPPRVVERRPVRRRPTARAGKNAPRPPEWPVLSRVGAGGAPAIQGVARGGPGDTGP